MARCNGPNCGSYIVWLKTAAGKNIPVDDNEVARQYQTDQALYDPQDEDLVPHHSTCPDAGQFRRN